jgi:hypothetical protein
MGIISIISVTVSRKPWTKLVTSSFVHVAVNPMSTVPKSSIGYKDFKILIVRLDAFLMLEMMISRDRVDNMSNNSGARGAVSESCG